MLDIPGLEVMGELGRGARGVVYRARSRGLEVAVKVPHLSQDAELARFRREGSLLASVNHPGLARVYEVGPNYIITEFIDGNTLAEELKAGPLTQSRVEELALVLAGALVEVHHGGLVHRDIKPQNIVWGPSGPKLIDFGLAQFDTSEATPENFSGTLLYASPEQTGMLKRPVDGRSDLYSVGVVLFECLLGRPPFWGEPADLIRQHAVLPAPALCEQNPRLSRVLSAIVARLLAKDPDDRYPSADSLLHDLRQLPALERQAEPVLASRTSWGNRDRPLVGRLGPLHALREAARSVSSGQGCACLLIGPAGSGKSRVVREFRHSHAGLVLQGKCQEDASVPFAAVHQALESSLGALLKQAPEATRQAREKVAAAARNRSRALRALHPMFAQFLESDEGGEDDADLSLEYYEAACGWMAELARLQGGLTVIMEDLQWADEGTQQLLLHLAPRLTDAPLLLVLSSRDAAGAMGDLEDALGPVVAARLELGPLTPAETAQFIQETLGAPAQLEVAALIHRQSQGNAFAIDQYLRACLDQGVLRPHWGQWRAEQEELSGLNLPKDIFELIFRRLLTLGPNTLAVLQTAAVLGGQFEPRALQLLFAAKDSPWQDGLAQSLAHGVLERRPDGGYVFAHDRIREALIAQWSPEQLAKVHLAIACAVDVQLRRESAEKKPAAAWVYARARHFVAGQGPAAKIFESCWQASELARAQCAFEAAHEFLRSCLQHCPPERRCAVLEALGEACEMTGRVEEAFHLLGEAVELESAPLRKARLRLRRCQLGLHNPDWGAGGVELGQALQEIGAPAPAGGWRSLLAGLREYSLYLLGRPVRALDPARADNNSVLVQLYDQTTVVGFYTGDLPRTMESLARSLRVTLTSGSTRESVRAFCQASVVLALGRAHALSQHYLGRAEQMAADLADPVSQRRVLAFRGLCMYLADQVEEASPLLRDALFQPGPRLPMGDFSIVLGALTWGQMLRGNFEELMATLERVRHLYRITSRSIPTELQILESYQAVALAALDEPEEARTRTPANSRRRVLFEQGCLLLARFFQGQWGAPADEPLRLVGDSLARRVRQRGEDPPSSRGPNSMPMHVKHALVARAYVLFYRCHPREEPTGQALAEFHEALRQLRETSRHLLFRSHVTLLEAGRLRMAGSFAAADEQLHTAQQMAEQLNSPWLAFEVWAERARLLTATGKTKSARRAAQLAFQMALQEGWNARARQLAREASLPFTRTATPGTDRLRVSGTASSLIQRRQLDALRELSLASARVFDPARLANLVLGQVVTLLGAQRALLLLSERYDDSAPRQLKVVAARSAEGPVDASQVSFSKTVVEEVQRLGRSVILNGGLEAEAHSVVAQDLRSILASPLRLRDEFLGVVYLDNSQTKGLFNEDDQELLEAMASHIAIGMESTRALQIELQLKVERGHRQVAERLRDFATQLSVSGSVEEIFTLLRITIHQEHNLEEFCAALTDGGQTRFVMGDLGGRQSLFQQALQSSSSCYAGPDLAVPCVGRSGTVAVFAVTGGEAKLDPRAREFCETLARQAALAIDQVLLIKQLVEIATTDALTGVSNRRHFFELSEREFAKARRYRSELALIILDIDFFKKFNDTYGHDVGDEVLKTVAQALKLELRTEDVLARYGGEEFVILLPETSLEDALRVTAERLRRRVEATPLVTETHGTLGITISLGVAAFQAEADLADVRKVLKRADEGLYRAKQAGRNRCLSLDLDLAEA